MDVDFQVYRPNCVIKMTDLTKLATFCHFLAIYCLYKAENEWLLPYCYRIDSSTINVFENLKFHMWKCTPNKLMQNSNNSQAKKIIATIQIYYCYCTSEKIRGMRRNWTIDLRIKILSAVNHLITCIIWDTSWK